MNSSFLDYFLALTPELKNVSETDVFRVLEEDKDVLRLSYVLLEDYSPNSPFSPSEQNWKSQPFSAATLIQLDPYMIMIFFFKISLNSAKE